MDKIGFRTAKTACPEKQDRGKCDGVVGASDLWYTICVFALACVGVAFVAFFTGTSVGRQKLIDEISASNLSITFSTRYVGDSIKSWVEVNPSVD